ncbi:MAG: arsenosugar biosynthesis radical SAM protein ArsS [Candidatus Omnitrophica bacterium]|nr:arsenosugar biosynthesis radical SAM protein ArsS [Candidatus Omnitrophota bacterium]
MAGDFKTAILSIDRTLIKRKTLGIVQVNLGDTCNQRCVHCHVNAGPEGKNIMPRRVMDDVIRFLSGSKGLMLDITGGCPELNPDFRYFIEKARLFTEKIIVRSNLTVLCEPGMEWLPEFYRNNTVKLFCSMPCYTKENVDKQRGQGVFDKSIRALNLLNDCGYGKDKKLEIDLVYNPGGGFLPGKQDVLEKDYRQNLEKYGVVFNHLITIVNAPINRFKHYLEVRGDFDEYMKLLINNFNRDVAADIMCRNLVSVGWDGILYDCDFNQSLGLSMRDSAGKIMEIRGGGLSDIEGKEIIFENHCYCCTAGAGSSCQGALVKYVS